MQNDMAVENSRKAALQDISTKLLSLRTAADSLRSIPFWAGTPHGASGDDSSYSLSVTSGAPKANYQIQVKRLATGEVWGHTATSGVRDFGAAMGGLNTFAAKTTTLTTLTDASGASPRRPGRPADLDERHPGRRSVRIGDAVHRHRHVDAR